MEVATKQYVDTATANIPTLESMTAVDAMLTSFGLSAAGNLQPAAAGTTETDTAVVQ